MGTTTEDKVVNVYGDYELIATLKTPEEVHKFMDEQVMKLVKQEKEGLFKETEELRKAVGKKNKKVMSAVKAMLTEPVKKKPKVKKKKVQKDKPKPNPMLPLTTKTFFVVKHTDLEEVVKEKYGFDYSFTGKEHCGNDTHHVFSAKKDGFTNPSAVDSVKKGTMIHTTRDVFDALCSDGVIIPGNYLVEVAW